MRVRQALLWAGRGGGVALILAVASAAAAVVVGRGEVATLLGLTGSAAALMASALLPTWLISESLARIARSPTAPAASTIPASAAAAMRRLRATAVWGQSVVAGLAALLAVGLALWLRPAPATPSHPGLGLGVAAMALAVPLMVCERWLHAASRRSPEAPALARLLRCCIRIIVVTGAAAVGRSMGLEWAVVGQWLAAAAVIAVGSELALRASIRVFLPWAGPERTTALGASVIAALLAGQRGSDGIRHGLKHHFGIDLARSWAVRFLVTASLPLATILLIIAWLVSGVTTLGSSERGVYERWGAPATVLGPGIHAHLPWPFGRVQRIEFGQIHALPLTALPIANPAVVASEQGIAVDAATPPSFDRLWDQTHATEATYLIPGALSTGGGGVGYQLLSSDVRILWRIALDDASARNAVYAVDDPVLLVRCEAMRQVQHTFAACPLQTLIGTDRDRLTSELRRGLQRRLDPRHCGIEITAVLIDAIHPPTPVVPAYHGVQAAEIDANTDVARARGDAAAATADASLLAAQRRDQGEAIAGEEVCAARGDGNLFLADRTAFTAAPAAMRLERWLQAFARSASKAQMTVVDHRLATDGGPAIDLRRFSAASE
jgi:regulator of protease activity HflC (stomatin/prohibitin superfamily)